MHKRHSQEASMRPTAKTGILVFGAAFIATTFVACATPPLQTSKSTSEIHAAEAVGAANVPQAALHLQLAKEELALSKKWAANNEKKKAVSMLTRAHADAELAIALSNENAEKLEAEDAMQRVNQLRQENQ